MTTYPLGNGSTRPSYSVNNGEDPILALAKTLDSLDVHINVVEGKAKRNESNRLTMLHLHALAAMIIGPLFGAIGHDGMRGVNWVLVRYIPGAPYSMAVVMFTGGVILAVATTRRDLRWEMVGLWMLLVWYFTLAASFAGACLIWLAGAAPVGSGRPSLYAPAVYFHLTGVMFVHLRTLRKMARERLSRRQAMP